MILFLILTIQIVGPLAFTRGVLGHVFYDVGVVVVLVEVHTRVINKCNNNRHRETMWGLLWDIIGDGELLWHYLGIITGLLNMCILDIHRNSPLIIYVSADFQCSLRLSRRLWDGCILSSGV